MGLNVPDNVLDTVGLTSWFRRRGDETLALFTLISSPCVEGEHRFFRGKNSTNKNQWVFGHEFEN